MHMHATPFITKTRANHLQACAMTVFFGLCIKQWSYSILMKCLIKRNIFYVGYLLLSDHKAKELQRWSRSTPRQRKQTKRAGEKAPSANSFSVYTHYPCHSGVWLAWLNYRYIIINHVALFIFIQHLFITLRGGKQLALCLTCEKWSAEL